MATKKTAKKVVKKVAKAVKTPAKASNGKAKAVSPQAAKGKKAPAKKVAAPTKAAAAKKVAKKAAPAKKVAPAKKAASRPVVKAKKAVAKKAVAKKAPAKKAIVKKVAVKKVVAKKVVAKKAVAKKVVAKKVVAKKVATKAKAPAAAVKKAAPAKATKAAATKAVVKTAAVSKSVKPSAKNKSVKDIKPQAITTAAPKTPDTLEQIKADVANPKDQGGSKIPSKVKGKRGRRAQSQPEPVVKEYVPFTTNKELKKVAVATNAAKLKTPVKKKHKVVKYTVDADGRPELPKGYKPDDAEEYMNPLQLEYFRQRLLSWRADLVEESKQTIENLKEEVRDIGDEAERATRETENALELRTRDRYRKLIGKIDSTLRRLEEGEYGFCVDTGDEIGLERLEVRLTAERTFDAQERWELKQKQNGD